MSEEQKPAADEARKAKKKPKRLSVKQAKFVNARIKGMSLAEAAGAAGYPAYRQMGFKVEKQVQGKLTEALDRAGLTQDALSAKLAKLTEAKETKFFSNKGIVFETREVEALDIQLRAVDIGLRGHGLRSGEDAGTDSVRHSAHTVCVVLGDSRAAANLAGMLSPDGPSGVVIDVAPQVDANAG